ncbi:response regulator transcription factor [Flavobacterium aciduliphilum]|uniref:AraC-like DNA-binding protein n=1 Tax=Flavobacterium aciduliphilum TaxID=1101402 RepID=A0A328YN85_9FLAO|nr:response regulator transcription factor [Flavobacterium aciduliphilum]RAR75309.1 AraC-like DNA-binding protein [Flavobacterium aciduliphilum]
MKHTILVVEDEYLIARDIKNILKEEGYKVIIDVDNVDYALEVLANEPISLVLLDINLKSDKNGIDLGRYLLGKDLIPFIYITSYTDKLTLDKASETRPYGYIVKPYKAIDVKTTVSIVLNNIKYKNLDIMRHVDTITDDNPFLIKKVISYIHEHVTERIEVQKLAEITPWKVHHFIKNFTRYIGKTPYNYVIDRKLEHAKALLVETQIPARQISYQLSFKSHSNFCRFFRIREQKTPDEYRKYHRGLKAK